ncbi:retinol dehydrogenase [Salinibacter sp. 10B]|uniref:SDR family oxidoreductase n=1 Tax=Salinibacter sp. 10B TaxID=1923971 RepID=UPI000CF3FA56|nr:SDR family oxidoreductase [Salinibacter sp. 10B]PQJ35132.1 retinol dehydrogenase [Salinibacter sp. 10B]
MVAQLDLKDLHDTVCVVTGANSGIGKETAKGLVRLGAHVVMVCRNEERGRDAQAEIQAVAQNAQPSQANATDLRIANLGVQDEVYRLGESLRADYDRVDVLINNAGVLLGSREETPDDIETTFAVNHLAPFLLTHLVLPLLKEAAGRVGEARVVTVSSEAHRGTSIDFDDLNAENSYGMVQAYGQSKLANILFTHELARRLRDTGVTANCVHPGVVATNLWQGSDWLSRLARLFTWLYKTPEEGAESVLYLAASRELEGVTGQYFKEMEAINPSPEAYDEKAAARLWRLSLKMTGLESSVEPEERGPGSP